jgi:hypothetical protein
MRAGFRRGSSSGHAAALGVAGVGMGLLGGSRGLVAKPATTSGGLESIGPAMTAALKLLAAAGKRSITKRRDWLPPVPAISATAPIFALPRSRAASLVIPSWVVTAKLAIWPCTGGILAACQSDSGNSIYSLGGPASSPTR